MEFRVITLPVFIGVMVTLMVSMLGFSQTNKTKTTKGVEYLQHVKENVGALDLGGGLALETSKEAVFKKLNKSEANLINNVYLDGENGFIYRISKGSKSMGDLEPEKFRITYIISNIEPVSREDIIIIFGNDYKARTLRGYEFLEYTYKNSDKRNLKLVFEESDEKGYFTSVLLYFQPLGQNLLS
ncbi:hypothetical protein [Brevibacillus sp. SIMBA_040]|uniref:hypothetical protein n=1 Tax=unclassified Brevibacillus TaxID=2684853 RepID=UPI00397C32A3